MNKTIFKISKMDCAAEEQMIRMKLQDLENIKSLNFNLQKRSLEVFHSNEYNNVLYALESLQLDAKLLESKPAEEEIIIEDHRKEQKLFLIIFSINFLFFLIEFVSGILAHSMGLIADSLDMLADAIIFGISLFVVGKSLNQKKRVAKISGYFQMMLAFFGMIEVTRRFLGFTEIPDYKTMILVSFFALVGNAVSLYLIQKAKSKKEVHIEAGRIFLSNDVIINFGVLAAGAFVLITNSKLPDLIIGIIVFIIVARGAYRILKL